MIYTLTLNPAIDKTVVVENLTPGGVNRIRSIRADVGGKGINVSKCLKTLGCPSTAAAFWGGTTGQQGMDFLAEQGIGSLPVAVAGDTRTNLKIIDPIRGENTDINEPGPEITAEDLALLRAKLDQAIQPGDILIFSGSLPRGCASSVYREWIAHYRELGARVCLDADGEALRLGLEGAPYLIKPNLWELSRLLGRELRTPEEAAAGAKQLLRRGIPEILVSLGGAGAVLVREDRCLYAPGLSVPVRSTVGAGDSMLAALACGWERGLTDVQRLKLAVAISAASVMCSGTQAPERETVENLYAQVCVREV